MAGDTIDKLVIKISSDVEDALKGISRVDAAVAGMDSRVKGVASRIRSATGKIAKSFAVIGTAGVTSVTALGTVLSKQAGDMESYMTTLETLYGSQEAAGEQMKWMLEFAKSTPFELPGLIEATTRLKAYGIEGQGVLGTLGDTASAMGKPIMMAVEALADAQTGEFERLKEFGVKAVVVTKDNYEQLGAAAEQVGKTALAYTDASGKQQTAIVDRNNREIVTSTLMSIWNEKYAGGMEKQSQTMKGMVSNIKDAMFQAGLAVMGFDKATATFKPGSLFEMIKNAVSRVLEIVNSLDFDAVASRITVVVDRVLATAATLFDELSPTWDNLKSIFDSMKGILTDMFDIFEDTGASTGTFTEALNLLTTALAAVFKWVDEHPEITKLVVTIGAAVVAFSFILPVVMAVAGAIGTMIGVATTLGGILAGSTTIIGGLGAVIALLGGPITLIIAAVALLAAAWATNLFGIRDKTKSVVSTLKGVWDSFTGFITDHKDKITNVLLLLTGPIGMIVLAFRNWDEIKDIVADISGWLTSKMSGLASSAKDWGSNLVQSFIDGITGMVDKVGGAVDRVADKVKDVLGIFSPAKEGPLSTLMDWGPNLVKSFADGIEGNIHLINDAIAGLASPIMTESLTLPAPVPGTYVAGSAAPVQVNISIRDPVVREDADIDTIVSKIESTLGKQLRSVRL